MPLVRRKPRRKGFVFVPPIESLEERVVPSVDPILEWNAVATEVNRVSYSGGENDSNTTRRDSTRTPDAISIRAAIRRLPSR